MYIGLKHLHSFLPYLLLTVLLFTFLRSVIAYRGKHPHTEGHRKNGLIVLILAHLQLLIGCVLYFVSPMSRSGLNDFGLAMKDSSLRLYTLEHPLMMILAITLITMAYSKSKKDLSDQLKHKVKSVYFGIALLLILSRIPWSAWL
ncbi:MAG: hypothetical protein CND86_00780 [Bacteroidetes bacterium MED-G21]|nr:MAG: hypothetical protein CND86_00780 [Bacteroidetes bacterium MED-G21]|tara:strand:+ start:542 stop:976 length:435 start_codon:yes stop_codon:yes gene_type:complete